MNHSLKSSLILDPSKDLISDVIQESNGGHSQSLGRLDFRVGFG